MTDAQQHWFTVDFYVYRLAQERRYMVKSWDIDDTDHNPHLCYQIFCSYAEMQELERIGY